VLVVLKMVERGVRAHGKCGAAVFVLFVVSEVTPPALPNCRHRRGFFPPRLVNAPHDYAPPGAGAKPMLRCLCLCGRDDGLRISASVNSSTSGCGTKPELCSFASATARSRGTGVKRR